MLRKTREDERSTCEIRNKRYLAALDLHANNLREECDSAKERERLAEVRYNSENVKVGVLEREVSEQTRHYISLH